MCIYKISLPHRPDNYIGFTSSSPPHILQQNCAHACSKLSLLNPTQLQQDTSWWRSLNYGKAYVAVDCIALNY